MSDKNYDILMSSVIRPMHLSVQGLEIEKVFLRQVYRIGAISVIFRSSFRYEPIDPELLYCRRQGPWWFEPRCLTSDAVQFIGCHNHVASHTICRITILSTMLQRKWRNP